MILSIRSRHPSCNALRKQIRVPYKAVYRHGSTTQSRYDREINSIESVQKAASKLLMKQAFDEGSVKHVRWGKLSEAVIEKDWIKVGDVKLQFPVVVKNIFGSRGKGNYKINNPKEFTDSIKGKDLSNYIVEEFFSGTREYRVHVTSEGAIYNLRKMLKTDTPEDKRWIRNDDTCVWICENLPIWSEKGDFLGFQHEISPKFDKPTNWDKIVEECIKALKAVGLDIGAVDIKVQSAKDPDKRVRKVPDFYIIEINSAPSIGKITSQIYKDHLPKILKTKYGKNTSIGPFNGDDLQKPRSSKGLRTEI